MSGYDKLQSEVKQAVLRLPLIVGNAAVNWVKDSFTQQIWRGAVFQAWKAVKSEKRKGAAILIKSGRLRRSIRIVKFNATSVSIGSDVPYAAAHNNGVYDMVSVRGHNRNKFGKAKASSLKSKRQKTITYLSGTSEVAAHTRTMNLPRRQFAPNDMRDSPVFVKDMESVIKNELSPFFK